MPKTRVISPTEALFVSTNATGAQDIDQLHRVQKIDYGTNITRTPVEQFGNQAPIDNVILEPVAVSLDFSYLVTNVANEANLGFVVDGSAGAISGFLNKTSDEKNYYILTVAEGEEANIDDADDENDSVIGIGNGFITNYTFEAAVGQFPTANVTIEALGWGGYGTSTSGTPLPSINPTDGQKITGQYFSLPDGVSGAAGQASALRPGDVVLDLESPSYGVDLDDAKIQSVRISVDLGREPQNKLGSAFPFSREITFPINVTVSVDANVGDLTTGNIADVLCNDQKYNLSVGLRKPVCVGVGDMAIRYDVRGASLTSQSFSSAIGSSKTVSIEWTAQVGGPRDLGRGLFISGALV